MWTRLQAFRNDRKPSALFAYFNSWWYFFRANEYSRAYRYLGREESLIYVGILVDTKDATIIYSGILEDFVIKDGDLYTITLRTCSKKLFVSKNINQEYAFARSPELQIIPSGLFCIPYSKALNINIRFVSPPQIESLSGDNQMIEKILSSAPVISPEEKVAMEKGRNE